MESWKALSFPHSLKTPPNFPARALDFQSFPVESKNVETWALSLPKRVGDPIMYPSNSTILAGVMVGSSEIGALF